jgi:hypothetical protein
MLYVCYMMPINTHPSNTYVHCSVQYTVQPAAQHSSSGARRRDVDDTALKVEGSPGVEL